MPLNLSADFRAALERGVQEPRHVIEIDFSPPLPPAGLVINADATVTYLKGYTPRPFEYAVRDIADGTIGSWALYTPSGTEEGAESGTWVPSMAQAVLTSVNTTAANRLESTPDLAVGDWIITRSPQVAPVVLTSHADVTTWPTGTVYANVLEDLSSTSQEINPDEGRATISQFSFSIVDKGQTITSALRAQLAALRGVRGRVVRAYEGEAGFSASQYQLICTQLVAGLKAPRGGYQVKCQGIVRETRTKIMELKSTTLAAALTATDTTMTVADASIGTMYYHGTSYTLNSGLVRGYLKIKQTGEVIGYSGKTATTFTGLQRGLFGTLAKPVAFDTATPQERRPEIEEFVYLEMPAPKLIYALMTGELYGDNAKLPAHWHCGISPTWVRLSDFLSFGKDFWVPGDDAKGLQMRFIGIGDEEGKRFIETELLKVLDAVQPEYADGTAGLRRLTRVSSAATPVAWVGPDDVLDVSDLDHQLEDVQNIYVIWWNWNGEKFTRRNVLYDAASANTHSKVTKVTELKFRGLHGSRITLNRIEQLLDLKRDRYGAPPIGFTATLRARRMPIDVAEIIRVQIPQLRDFTNGGSYLDRAFECQAVTRDWRKRRVRVKLFGSTAPIRPRIPQIAVTALTSGFYSSVGTALGSVSGVTISSGVLTAAPAGNITGAALNTSGSVLYYIGDLTIAAGVDLKIAANIELRVLGALTINGKINGKGRGYAGVADTGGTVGLQGQPAASATAGTVGFIGSTQGSDGLQAFDEGSHRHVRANYTNPAPLAAAPRASVPELMIGQPVGNYLAGMPDDLRGTSGGPGGRLWGYRQGYFEARGAQGGAGGAGLVIICRGLYFGASGQIDLSGDAGSAPTLQDPLNSVSGVSGYPGAGAGGHPGALYVFLDGDAVPLPDMTGGKFLGLLGATPAAGSFLPREGESYNSEDASPGTWPDPKTGSNKGRTDLAGLDVSANCYRIQYLPTAQTATEDPSAKPPAVTGLTATGIVNAITVQLTLPPLGTYKRVQILASPTNDRADVSASIVAYLGDGQDRIDLPYSLTETRYLWARTETLTETGNSIVSDWYPSSSTGGVSATALATGSGPAGESVIIQYSATGTSGWHDPPFVTGDLYMRQKIGTGGTYTPAIRIVGETGSAGATGAAGNFVQYVFREASAQPSTPTGNGIPLSWSDSPPASPTSPVWMSKSTQTSAAVLVGSWSTPVRLTGDTGPALFNLQVRGTVVRSAPDALLKSSGATAWDSDAYSLEAYPAARVSFRAGSASQWFMAGLNEDPAADQTYTSIDFAWYCEGSGTLYIYESGNNIGAVGSFTPSTQLAIDYDGATVRYYKDSALIRAVPLAGKKLYFDSSFYSVGASLSNLIIAPASVKPKAAGNLLSLDQWTPGASSFTSLGNFGSSYSVVSESAIVTGGEGSAPLDPYGQSSPLWECRPDSGGNASGGFYNSLDFYGVDHTKALRLACWFRWNDAAQGSVGSIYLGPSAGGETRFLPADGGGVASNPYAFGSTPSAVGLRANKWYLGIAIVHGSGYTGGPQGLAGIWDPASGERVVTGFEYRFLVGAVTQTMRAYPYDYTNTSARIWLACPRADVLDGNEPTIAQLLIAPDVDNTDAQRIIPDAEIGDASQWEVGGSNTFNASGGTVGGYIRITDAGSVSGDVIPVRPRGLRVVPAKQWVKVTIRAKRVADAAGAAKLIVRLWSVNYRENRYPTGGDVANIQGTLEFPIYLQSTGVNVETTRYLFLGTPNSSCPYLFAAIWAQQWKSPFSCGTTDLDYIDIEPTSAPSALALVTAQGGTYTFALTDLGQLVEYSGTSPATFTVDNDENFLCDIGSRILVRQQNSGALSIAGGSGVTIQSPVNQTGSRTLSGRYARAELVKVAANTWSLDGSLA